MRSRSAATCAGAPATGRSPTSRGRCRRRRPAIPVSRSSPRPCRRGRVYDSGHGLERFVRPTSLDNLFRCLGEAPTATLIAGGTDVMVGVTQKGDRHPVVVSLAAVPELRTFAVTPDAVVLGAGLTLTDIEEHLHATPEAAIPLLGQLLPLFASRPIRNRATLAGNIVTASPIGDMPPVLLALDAEVVCASVRGDRTVPIDAFFTGYRKTALAPDEIARSIAIPKGSPSTRFDTLKVSKRRDLDISIVAAAFRLELDASETVVSARLGYGGVAATPVRARKAEAALVGKRFGRRRDRGRARDPRERVGTPIDDVRARKEYRRGLAASTFESFWTGAPPAKCTKTRSSPRSHRGRPSCARVPARQRARARDRRGPLRRRSAAAARRCSTGGPLPHAARARRASSRDDGRPRSARRATPCSSRRTSRGEPVGAVAPRRAPAGRRRGAFRGPPGGAGGRRHRSRTARRAAAAGRGGSTSRCPRSWASRPRSPRAASTASRTSAGSGATSTPRLPRRTWCSRASWRSAGQEHFYLETHAALAVPGEDGEVPVWSSTQHPSEVQAKVAEVLGLPRHKVVVRCRAWAAASAARRRRARLGGAGGAGRCLAHRSGR